MAAETPEVATVHEVLHDLRHRIRLLGVAATVAPDPDVIRALIAEIEPDVYSANHALTTWAPEALIALRRAFASAQTGGDVTAFAEADDVGVPVDDLAEALHRTVSDLYRMDAVVVAVVHGVAAGAGLALAAAADLVLAGASARFTLAYTMLGFSPDGGSSLLTASLGLHRAMQPALLIGSAAGGVDHAWSCPAHVVVIAVRVPRGRRRVIDSRRRSYSQAPMRLPWPG